MVRKIIRVDEDQCAGCGDCVRLCRLGALALSAGKARLVADRLCDGLGACAKHCQHKALLLERREAAPFRGRFVSNAEAAGLAGRLTPVTDRGHPSHAVDELAAEVADEPDADDIFQYRLGSCCQATHCGRLCQRLVKQPGKAGVWCVDVKSGTKTNLYQALTEPSFTCPEGVF